MKASEAKPLNAEELETLQGLMQRWVLCDYPSYDGSSEQSDAIQTYLDIKEDAKAGKIRYAPQGDERERMMKEQGEVEL